MAVFFVTMLFLFIGITAQAQKETKGRKQRTSISKKQTSKPKKEKGRSNRRQLRSLRYKAGAQKGDKARKGDIMGRRVTPKVSPKQSSASYARPNPYAGKPRKTEAQSARSSRKQAPRIRNSVPRANAGPGPGKGKVRPRSASSASRGGRRTRVNPYAGKSRKTEAQKARSSRRQTPRIRNSVPRTTATPGPGKGKVRPRSASSSFKATRRVNPYAGKSRKTEAQKARSSRRQAPRIRNSVPRTTATPGPGKGKVRPRSASSSFKATRRVNPYAGKPRKTEAQKARSSRRQAPRIRNSKPKVAGGAAERKVRPRSASSVFKVNVRVNPYAGKGRKKEKGFKGDITGRRLRKNFTKKKLKAGKPLNKIRASQRPKGERAAGRAQTGGFIRPSRKTEEGWKRGTDITGRRRRKVGSDIKVKRGRYEGRGKESISGRKINNGGNPIEQKYSDGRSQRHSRFQGSAIGYKSRPKGAGGSISGRSKNNRRQPLEQRYAGSKSLSHPRFQGNIIGYKGRPKGSGGSISGRSKNNDGQALRQRYAGSYSLLYSRFTGNVKGKNRPPKGAGGSVSGRSKNNDGKALGQRYTDSKSRAYPRFQGNIVGYKKRMGGGGSVSGKLWNNNKKPIREHSEHIKMKWATGSYDGRFRKKPYHAHNFKNTKVMHPSAKYTLSAKQQNGKKEKEKLFSFRIWWSKLFKKNENQPESVKNSGERKPRYDPSEKGLWND